MYSTVMNTDHPKQSAAMNHGRPPRGGKAVVWDGGEGREGGRSGCGVWECLELLGARSGVGAVGGRGQMGPRAHFCGGICVPNSSSCDIDGHRASRRASRVAMAESGEVGRAPVKTFLERPRPSIIAARAVFQGTTLDVAHSAGPRPSSPRRSPVDGIDRGSPPHRTRAPVLPLTRVPRPCTPWYLSIHRKGTSQL